MRIALSAGHNVYVGKYFDCGACRNPYVEADITKETVRRLIPLLQAQGHIVKDVTPYNEKFGHKKDSHVKRCKAVDAFNADLFLDIHVNAGGGRGVEVWVHNMESKSVPYAQKICNNISTIAGIPSRGIKTKPAFWSVSLTKKPAMIIEGAFIDSSDMEKLDATNYARSIAKAFGKVEKQITKPNISNELYRVRKSWNNPKSQIGAFRNLNNAKKLVDNNRSYKVYNSKGVQVYPKKSVSKSSQTWRKYITGREVRNLQTELNKQYKLGVKVDGYFGDEMEAKCTVNIRYGAKGNLTRIIQGRLIAKGYKPNNGLDGSFGFSTHQKVVQFQRSRKILDNGIVGKYT